MVHHLVPHIPIAKDAMKIPFHLVGNGSLGSYTPTWKEPHSQLRVCGDPSRLDEVNSKAVILEVNGVHTQLNEFDERLEDTYYANNGETVYGSYIATHGGVSDGIGCFLDWICFPTNASKVLRESLTYLSHRMGNVGQILVSCFSRANLTLLNAMSRISHTVTNIFAAMLAPPRLPSKGSTLSYQAVMSSRDGVTTYSQIQNQLFKNNLNSYVKKGSGLYFCDHTFNNEVYGNWHDEYIIKNALRLRDE